MDISSCHRTRRQTRLRKVKSKYLVPKMYHHQTAKCMHNNNHNLVIPPRKDLRMYHHQTVNCLHNNHNLLIPPRKDLK